MSGHPIYDRVKRTYDLLGSLVLLALLAPVLVVIGIAVIVTMGSPVLFRQQRPGRNERVFTLLKFRTMQEVDGAAGDVAAVASDGARLTPFGRFLRSTSLDELPQLFNVLRGDMSLIGPRPLLVQYLGHYTPRQARRHLVLPGITGWAQVNGRNAASWDDRLEMDAWYAENYSAVVDSRIALMTIGAVFSRKGVAAEGQATVEPLTAGDSARESEDE